jgi:electron transfer flavoprotein beta subunit
MNPFDENALEAALRLKEAAGGVITMLSMGVNLSQAVMLKALATGPDDLLLLDDEALDREKLDSLATAQLLAAAISKRGAFDLILTGRQASDTNSGQVGLGIAQLLGVPAVTLARAIEVTDGVARVERVLPEGYEVVTVPLPALVTVSHEVGELRYPRMGDIKAAKEKPQERWSASDLGLDPSGICGLKMVRLAAPVRERQCHLVEGNTPEEAGERLAIKLREDKLV